MKRSIAAMALVVATPAFGPRVSSWPLEVEAFVDWTATRGTDEVAVDASFVPSAAGVEVAFIGIDGDDWTPVLVRDAVVDDGSREAFALGSGESIHSSIAGLQGNDVSVIAAASDARSFGSGPASFAAHASTVPALLADSVSDDDAPDVHPVGANARNTIYVPAARSDPPFHVAAIDPRHHGSNPWHHDVNPPGVIVKDENVPGLDDLLHDDPSNPGNGGPPGPFLVDNDPDDPPIGFVPTDFTPTDFTPPENLRVTIEANAVPEPGTLALVGLGLAGLALLRRKPSPIQRRRR